MPCGRCRAGLTAGADPEAQSEQQEPLEWVSRTPRSHVELYQCRLEQRNVNAVLVEDAPGSCDHNVKSG